MPKQLEKEKIISTLQDPRVESIRQLLGPLIKLRIEAPDNYWHLLHFLETDNFGVLSWYEQKCRSFIIGVKNIEDAIQKFEKEIGRQAETSPALIFNSRFADLFSEIAAVAALSDACLSNFETISPQSSSKKFSTKTPDFQFSINERSNGEIKKGVLEVKNVRSPVTIFDVLAQARDDLAEQYPTLNRLDIRCEYYWDNHVTDELRDKLLTLFTDISASGKPGSYEQDLGNNVTIRINVSETDHNGSIHLQRNYTFDRLENPLYDREALSRKLEMTIANGVEQLNRVEADLRVLCINIQSPEAMLDEATVNMILEKAKGTTNGGIELLLMHANEELRRTF